MNGKGDRNRTANLRKFRAEYDRIFRKKGARIESTRSQTGDVGAVPTASITSPQHGGG